MNITIRYFAALRERIGCASEECDVPSNIATVGALRGWLAARGDPWRAAFGDTKKLRAAVDQSMASEQTRLHDRAEVAFFPPVTGG
jgi:molybdopterin synthase sulfur carrier subunit